MSNPVLWQGFASRGNVLSTELNSLTNGSRSAAGGQIDNATNLDTYGLLVLSTTFGTNPSSGGRLSIYMIFAADGTNYCDGSASVDPGGDRFICDIFLTATTSAQIKFSCIFALVPSKTKFIALNSSGQTMAASSSTIGLFTTNDLIS